MECRLIFFYKTYIHLAVLHVTFTCTCVYEYPYHKSKVLLFK